MTNPAEPVPGNFYSFNLEIEVTIKGNVEIGYRSMSFRDSTSGQVRWGTLTTPDPEVERIPWVDDERNGLSSRNLEKPEDALGAQGKIGDLPLQFESILAVSQNHHFVVFALHSPENNIRLAYGFERRIFEPPATVN